MVKEFTVCASVITNVGLDKFGEGNYNIYYYKYKYNVLGFQQIVFITNRPANIHFEKFEKLATTFLFIKVGA